MSDTDTKRDYRDTVFLPKTDFPMKAGLPQKEPEIAARWEADRLYEKLRDARRGRQKFMYHDGPPYANGAIHIGHALNHTIKDMVCRTQNLLGKDAPYVPGWDCHGLPIEWKVEEQYRKAKKNKDEVPLLEFRAECRAYAQSWVDVQRGQLKRLGVMADWDNPYLTMQPESEATIVAELPKFAASGQLHPGAKPVVGSPVENARPCAADSPIPRSPPVSPRSPATNTCSGTALSSMPRVDWPALSRRQAGDVEPGRKDRAGRGRGRVRGHRLDPDRRGVRDHREPDPRADRRARGDLDDHAVDDPGEPGDRLWAGG